LGDLWVISIRDIERVYEIIDRELSFIEISQASAKRKQIATRNWLFVREQFRQLCLELAIKEGLIDSKTTHIPQ